MALVKQQTEIVNKQHEDKGQADTQHSASSRVLSALLCCCCVLQLALPFRSRWQ